MSNCTLTNWITEMKRINSQEDRVLRLNQEKTENLNRCVINENEEKRIGHFKAILKEKPTNR